MDPKFGVVLAAVLLPFLVWALFAAFSHYLRNRRSRPPEPPPVRRPPTFTAAEDSEEDPGAGQEQGAYADEHPGLIDEPELEAESDAVDEEDASGRDMPLPPLRSEEAEPEPEPEPEPAPRGRKRERGLMRMFRRKRKRARGRSPLAAARTRQEPGFGSSEAALAPESDAWPQLPPLSVSGVTDPSEEHPDPSEEPDAPLEEPVGGPRIVRTVPQQEPISAQEAESGIEQGDAAEAPEPGPAQELQDQDPEEAEASLSGSAYVEQADAAREPQAEETASQEPEEEKETRRQLPDHDWKPAEDGAASEAVADAAAAGEPETPGAQGEEEQDEEFPSIAEVINEFFYYVAYMTVPEGLLGSQSLKLASQIVQQTRLDRRQELLGHVPGSGWEKPRPDKSYRHVVWAVPLSGRNSYITSDEMAEFVRLITDQMRRRKGSVRFMSHLDIERRFDQIEQFCLDNDLGVSLTLVAKEGRGDPQRASSIIELLMAEKLDEVDSRMLRMGNGEIWYEVFAGEDEKLGRKSPDRRLGRLRLYMDVPHVTEYEAAYDEMLSLGRKLSRVLDFAMVNDEGDEFDLEELEAGRGHVIFVCERMIESGVRPGSKLARALFS